MAEQGLSARHGRDPPLVNSDDMLAPLSLKRARYDRATGADLVAGTCERIGGDDGRVCTSTTPTAGPAPKRSHSGPSGLVHGLGEGRLFFSSRKCSSHARSGNASAAILKPHLFWAMDWELWLRCALAGAAIVRIPDILGVSREHTAQKTTSKSCICGRSSGSSRSTTMRWPPFKRKLVWHERIS